MIHYRNDVRNSGVSEVRVKATVRKLLRALEEWDAELSLLLVDDAEMRRLNKKHRMTDKPTDVLSFPFRACHPERSERMRAKSKDRHRQMLGDIVISVETARRQAKAYDAPLYRELERLLIHGLLHLLGHDHHETGERRRMEAEERRLAQCIGMPWPYNA